jgi:hypothetical protein
VKINHNLIVAIIIILLSANIGIITYNTIDSDQLAYAHNFVPAIAASFITRIDQIRVQTKLVENNIPLNLSLAKQHAEIASELFDNNLQNDLYYNAEGNNGLAQKISHQIPLALSNLQKAVRNMTIGSKAGANQPKQQQQQQQHTTTTPSILINEIKEIVNNINDILDKAVYVRIDKYDLTNSTVHALVLADITEKAYNDYSYAYGIKPVMFSGSSSSMMMDMDGGMGMMMMGSGPSASSSTTNNSTMNHRAITNNSKNNSNVINATAYQQAQGLAMIAQQIFNNDLKPASSANNSLLSSANASSGSTNTTTTTITSDINKIENNLTDLKNAIDTKAPAMDVMKIVHGDIHPALLTSYNLQLRR